jgi:GntR family transcriptional regulator
MSWRLYDQPVPNVSDPATDPRSVMRPRRGRGAEIEQALRSEITGGRAGDRLPSEAALCERFGVSRMTARTVVDRLANLGLVDRVPGSGSFIADPPMHRPAGALQSFSQDMRSRGLNPSSRVLQIEQQRPNPEVGRALEVANNELVIFVRRLRLANDQPMALEQVTLPRRLAAIVGDDLETGSMHAAMERIGHRPTVARGSVHPEAAMSEDARLLGLEEGTPLLVEDRVVRDQDGVPIEMSSTRYSPTRYVFDIDLRR